MAEVIIKQNNTEGHVAHHVTGHILNFGLSPGVDQVYIEITNYLMHRRLIM